MVEHLEHYDDRSKLLHPSRVTFNFAPVSPDVLDLFSNASSILSLYMVFIGFWFWIDTLYHTEVIPFHA